VAFSPEGDRVIAAHYTDQAVKIWDLTIGGNAEWANFAADPAGFPGLSFAPDGVRLVASAGDGSVTSWDMEGGKHVSASHHADVLVFDVDVNADGTLAASAGGDGAHVWDPTTGDLRFSVVPEEMTPDLWMQTVAWSPVADVLATASVAGPALIVDSTGATVQVLDQLPGTGVYAAAFSPDGRLLATAAKQSPGERWDPAAHHVTIWDWQEGRALTTIQTSSLGLAFDPSGQRLATSSVEEGQAEVWDVATGTRLLTLVGHSAGVVDVSWDTDPARDRLATASADGTVRLWNGGTGITELVLEGHTSPIWRVAFSPDGSRLASAGRDDGTIRVWALDIEDLLDIAANELTRSLSDAECREFLHLTACPQAAEGV
jgi:WD40 repeat protein